MRMLGIVIIVPILEMAIVVVGVIIIRNYCAASKQGGDTDKNNDEQTSAIFKKSLSCEILLQRLASLLCCADLANTDYPCVNRIS